MTPDAAAMLYRGRIPCSALPCCKVVSRASGGEMCARCASIEQNRKGSSDVWPFSVRLLETQTWPFILDLQIGRLEASWDTNTVQIQPRTSSINSPQPNNSTTLLRTFGSFVVSLVLITTPVKHNKKLTSQRIQVPLHSTP